MATDSSREEVASAPAMTPLQEKLTNRNEGAFALYKEMAVGTQSVWHLAWYEFLLFGLSNLPGLPGFGLRSLLYPTLFKSSGRRPAFGRGVVLRNPGAMELGKKILIDDYVTLDARGEKSRIVLGDRVSIGRFTTVTGKDGAVEIESGANIGSYCRIATQSKIRIGESVLIAAYCYIGPGNHQEGDENQPLISREMDIKGGVEIGAHAWIGARSTILDGVKIGERAIVGAHSLVREDVPPGAVVAGCPAKRIR